MTKRVTGTGSIVAAVLLAGGPVLLIAAEPVRLIEEGDGGQRINAEADPAYRLELTGSTREGQRDSHGIRLFRDGQYALVADRRGDAVLCFDVSDPKEIELASRVSTAHTRGAHYATIGREGRYAYTGAAGCFTVLDVSDPEAIAEVAAVRCTGSGNSQQIVIGPDNATAYFAATGANTLFALDISDKNAPRVVGSLSGKGPPNFFHSVAHLEMHPSGEVLFAASYRDHRVISLDVSEPGEISVLDSSGDHLVAPHEMVYDRGYLYIGAMYDNGAERPREQGALVVYDASDPAALAYETELRMEETGPRSRPFDMLHGLRLDGERNLLFASSQNGNGRPCTANNSALSVFDVSDPAAPVWLLSYQSCDRLNGAQQVDFRGDWLFTANHEVPSVTSFRLRKR